VVIHRRLQVRRRGSTWREAVDAWMQIMQIFAGRREESVSEAALELAVIITAECWTGVYHVGGLVAADYEAGARGELSGRSRHSGWLRSQLPRVPRRHCHRYSIWLLLLPLLLQRFQQ
jgi:hypothetical protein